MTGSTKSLPTATVQYDISDPTDQNVTATLINESEPFTVTNNGGSKSYIFTENGEFVFEIRDEAGNTAQIPASVSWIDKTIAAEDVYFDLTAPTNGNVTATFNTRDGELTVLNNNGSTTYTFTDNGEFTFIAQDREGNILYFPVTVDWIDRTAPTAEIRYEVVDGRVIATLVNNSEDIIILNNNGSNSYTFDRNGQFTFTIQDLAGNIAEITASTDQVDSDLVASGGNTNLTNGSDQTGVIPQNRHDSPNRRDSSNRRNSSNW